MRRLVSILPFLTLAAPAPAAEWDRSLWDPGAPVEGQVELPLPCGGAMVFVPVATPVAADDPLADRQVQLGGADPRTGYLDYFRTDFLRGGFSRDGAPVYYIGKYEVTRDQWAAATGECPEPSRGGARPQGGVSWFDAIAFTRELTEWLRANAPEALPSEDHAPGYLRLPTEVEWEYAARGGGKLDAAAFRAALPPMEGGVTDHAWHSGRRSANGAYRPIGMKLPNPLGLYGMFGGVEELMLEPFRLNRLGRLHGQIGGFVTRGGSIETSAEELRSSLRAEWPFFDAMADKATVFDGFGLRPVISVTVNTSLARSTLYRDRWMESVAAAPDDDDDPLAVLDAMSDRQTDQSLLNELAFVRGHIVSDRRARDEASERALRLSLLNGAVLIRWMRQENGNLARGQAVLATLENALAQPDQPEALRERYARQKPVTEQAIAAARENLELSGSAYLTALIALDEEHSDEEVAVQAAQLVLELKERGQEGLSTAIDRFADGIARRGREPGLSREEMLDAALR